MGQLVIKLQKWVLIGCLYASNKRSEFKIRPKENTYRLHCEGSFQQCDDIKSKIDFS